MKLIPKYKYTYKLRIKDSEEFFLLLSDKFKLEESSGIFIRNIEKPFNIRRNGNSFEVERNLQHNKGGSMTPNYYGVFKHEASILEVTVKYKNISAWIFILLYFTFFSFLLYEGTSILRSLFASTLIFSFFYIIALLNFHINEERFSIYFDKYFKHYIFDKNKE